jgi:serralysin
VGATIMATFQGTSGNDTQVGIFREANEFFGFGRGSDSLVGGVLRDVFHMSIDEMTDYVDGGKGRDLLDYSGSVRPVGIVLAEGGETGAVTVGTATVAKILNIEDVTGSQYGDSIVGNTDTNVLNGADGNDTINGGKGDDLLIGGAGNDSLVGSLGSDTVSYAGSTVGMNIVLDGAFSSPESGVVGAGAYQITSNGFVREDTFSSVENAIGSGFDDSIRASVDRNMIDGSGGNDTILSLIDGQTDQISGGIGIDLLDYGGWIQDQDLEVTLGEGGAAGQTRVFSAQTGSFIVEDTLFSIENVSGAGGDDSMTGNSDANVLVGREGNDTFAGGGGADTLTGSEGNDMFVYTDATDSTLSNPDVIMGFQRNVDRIDLRGLANETADHQPLNLISGPFTGEAGQVTVRYAGGYVGWQVNVDLDGDQASDFLINVRASGWFGPLASDFLF